MRLTFKNLITLIFFLLWIAWNQSGGNDSGWRIRHISFVYPYSCTSLWLPHDTTVRYYVGYFVCCFSPGSHFNWGGCHSQQEVLRFKKKKKKMIGFETVTKFLNRGMLSLNVSTERSLRNTMLILKSGAETWCIVLDLVLSDHRIKVITKNAWFKVRLKWWSLNKIFKWWKLDRVAKRSEKFHILCLICVGLVVVFQYRLVKDYTQTFLFHIW